MFILQIFIFTIVSFLDSSISLPTISEQALILTPMLEENNAEEARNASLVDPKVFLGLESYSGFLTVNKTYNSNLFFWYFPVPNKPVNETPVILWLQGGPGASSLNGVFNEFGPIEYVNNSLKLRDLSWGKNNSLIFIDNPVGAGYSFTDNPLGFAWDMQTYGNHLYSALQQLLILFPELREAPLHIAGESYAGRYVPALAMEILNHTNTYDPHINLQGLILGNPVLERETIANVSKVFYAFGLIDEDGVAEVKAEQDAYIEAIYSEDYGRAYEFRNKLLDKLEGLTKQHQFFNYLKDDIDLEGFVKFLADGKVKHALHVGDIHFAFLNSTVAVAMTADFLAHTRGLIENLLEHYRILIYCGQLDLMSPCVPNAEAHHRWNWSKHGQFLNARRMPWNYGHRLAGYCKSGGGLTEVLVRGAGHIVPLDMPAPAEEMIYHFVRNQSLPGCENTYYNTVATASSSETTTISFVKQVKITEISESSSSGTKAVMVISLLINLFLMGCVVIYFFYKRSKKQSRHESWMILNDSLQNNDLDY